jgi:hypothetical protein
MISIKQGATFAVRGTYTPAAGALPNLQGATITSQIRMKGKLIAELDVELANDGMSFLVDGGSTAGWPAGRVDWDMRIVIGNSVYYTDTAELLVASAITKTP